MSTKASEEESHHDESDITDEFIDDDGDKSGYFPGKTITLQMLLGANVLQPGKGAMSIEYLGQKFIGDLLADGKIKSHETETIFCSPSAWAIYCKRIINPDKRSSGCGWASVKYKGKKLDAYKAAYHRKLLQKEKEDHKDDGPDVEIIEDTEEDKTAMEPPPVRRNVVQYNTISNRNILHDANTLIESVPFTSVGKIQPFLLSVSSSTILLMDFHCHLTNNEVCGYLGGTWDINAHNLSITHAFPCRNSRFDRDKAAMCELQIQKLMVKKNLHLVGWYHSHPRFPVQPTLRDCDAQLEYQIKMRGPTEASYTPCVGFICSPYNDVNNALESSILSFWVLPPPENRPAEYGRPMLMSYSLVQDETLSEDIKEEMMLTVDYYKQFNRELINFMGIYKNEVSYIDKLKKTLAPKLPLDSRSGHFWNWIRELLGLDPEEIVVIPDPPPPPPPVVPKLPEPISGGSSMVVNLTGPDEGSVGTEVKNDEDFDGMSSEMGDSDVISLKDDDNKAGVSLGVPSLQAQLKRPSGLNMTPSPLSSALVVLPTNLSSQANPPAAVANAASNNHGGSITTNTSSPRDSPITIPSNSASPAKFEIPVRASPSPAKSDTSSCRSRTRNSPAPSPVKLSIGDILGGSGNRNSPTLSSLIGNMGGNVSNIHDLYAATFASLGTSIPSNLLSQDYASLFQNTKRDEYGLSALNALAQVAAASGISNTQINETLLHSLNRSIGSSSSSGKSNQTSTVTTSSATMSSSTAPSASSSSASAAAAAAAVASSTGLPPIPNMKEFMQQLEKGNLSLLMQSQYANPLAGMTGLTGQAGSGGGTSGKSGSSRSSGKSRSKAAQAQQQQQQQQLQQAQQQLLQQQQMMDYADFTSKFDQGKLADLMKSPEYSQMLLQQAQALGSLGSEISIIKKPSSKGNSSNSGGNSGNNNSSNNSSSSNNAGNNTQSGGNKKDSASDLITKLRTIFSTDSYLPPMPTAADINLLAEQSQKVPEIQQILNSGNLDDIQVLLKAQSLSNNTLDFALFMQGTSGANAGAGEGSSKTAKSAAAKEEREREREREREQRERDNANAAAAAAAAAVMNPYLSASNLSALFEPVQRTTSEKSGGKSSKNKGSNTGSQTNVASNPAEMLNSLFTSAVGGTSAADMNALLYGQGKGAPDLSMLFGGVSSAATTSSTSSTTSTAAAAAAAAKQSLDYLSMFPNFSAAKLPEMSALFQSDKFEIPDPLAKATLEANNMYLAPSASLLKLQQEAFNSMMMKPPKSSSSSTSSSSKIETPPPIVASPGARSTPTKSANRDSPSLPKYNFSAVDLAVSSVPLAASSPLGGVADLSRKTPQTPPVDMSAASPSISSTPPVSGSGSGSAAILPPYKKRMEFSSIADLVAAPPSKMPKMSTENLDP